MATKGGNSEMSRPATDPTPVRDIRARLLALLAALVLIALLAVGLHASQTRSRDEIASRFGSRTTLAAAFVQSYVNDLLDREQATALRSLSAGQGPELTANFTQVSEAFGFPAAVLLDAGGRALAVTPNNPALLGQPIAARYAHLRAAVGGSRAVSAVVPSAVTHEPITAFAVPFDTPAGRRVFSGAYAIAETPLSTFLRNSSFITGSTAYLVDSQGNVVASVSPTSGVAALSATDRPLALILALGANSKGHYGPQGSRYFAAAAVSGTPWTLVTTAPTGALFAPVQGASRVIAWLVVGLLALALVALVHFGANTLESRRQLQTSNETLEHIARTDELTGTFNRRHLRERLDEHMAASLRHGYPVSLALFDVDYFKRVNDTFGHSAGDSVLQDVAARIADNLRLEDVLGRWGGEEFILVLPHLDLAEAVSAAERIRTLVDHHEVAVGSGGDVISVTVSAGVATILPGEHADAAIHRADLALYRAKAAGRNVVRSAEPATQTAT